MASTEQEGVSPATAGGARTPNPGTVDNSIAYALAHHYGFLPLDVRYSAAAAARAVMECWTRSRPVPNVEILPAAELDPRDAEIVRLREETRLLYKRLDRDNQRAWDHAEGRSRRYSEVRDRIYRALGEEPPAVLGLWADLAKQVNRLIDTLTVEVAQHDQTKAEYEQAGIDAARAIQKCLDVEAERDRLRAELDLISKQQETRELDRIRGIALVVLNLLPEQEDRRTVDLVREIFIRRQNDRDGLGPELGLPVPEPRRWVAGDPEPEVGTTVQSSRPALDHTWTLRRKGNWHGNTCRKTAEQCDSLGVSWGWLLREYGELVEVVNRNGR